MYVRPPRPSASRKPECSRGSIQLFGTKEYLRRARAWWACEGGGVARESATAGGRAQAASTHSSGKTRCWRESSKLRVVFSHVLAII